MAKTFEALMKAEKEHLIRPDEDKILALKPQAKVYIQKNFKLSPQIIEEYYRMKNNILNICSENKVKTLLFSSSTPKEGCSTTIINFAITLASGGEKVLLVDANLRNPTVHDFFNLDKKNGLTELILNNLVLQNAIKKTHIKNLSVVTCGIPHSNPATIFESNNLSSLIEQMKAQTNWVFFDTSPINSYSDFSALAANVDGVIMVIQAGKTRWESAKFAKERLEKSKALLLGTVLNRKNYYIPEWLYKRL